MGKKKEETQTFKNREKRLIFLYCEIWFSILKCEQTRKQEITIYMQKLFLSVASRQRYILI